MARASKPSRSMSTFGGGAGLTSAAGASGFFSSGFFSSGFLSSTLSAGFSESLRGDSGDFTSLRSATTTSRVGFAYVHVLSKVPYTGSNARSDA